MDGYLQQLLDARFDSRLDGRQYENEKQYQNDMTSFLALVLFVAGGYRAVSAEEGYRNLSPYLPVSFDEAMEYFERYPSSVLEISEDVQNAILVAENYIVKRVNSTSADVKSGFRLFRVSQNLALSDFSVLALMCSYACAVDEVVCSAFKGLSGSDSGNPTLCVVLYLYSILRAGRRGDISAFYSQNSPENRFIFLTGGSMEAGLNRELILSPDIASYLCGGNIDDSGLYSLSHYGDDVETDFLRKQTDIVDNLIGKICKKEKMLLVLMQGNYGIGRRAMLSVCAEKHHINVLYFSMNTCESKDEYLSHAYKIALLALLDPYIICLDAGDCDNSNITAMLNVFSRYGLSVFVTVQQGTPRVTAKEYIVTQVDFPMPDIEQVYALWEKYAAPYGVAKAQWKAIAAKHVLTPENIKSALEHAALSAEISGGKLDEREISAATLLLNTGQLSKVADRIDIYYTWDDLILGERSIKMLRDICKRYKYRHIVDIEWGYSRKSAYGKGLSVLLYGPPGTGKTMSAQVLAGELDLPLYRVNLSQVISKYIGETAKNLDAIFREAKSSNVVLFFDEADALFAKRTEVKSSNDRHANSESSYLLQKIEDYSGISILATNLVNNFDEAFRRRINYMVNINMPSREERLELWRNSVPAKAPLNEDVEFNPLSEIEISGSTIKAASLQAAYFAADEGQEICMRHFIWAVRLELQKLGRVEPHFMSIYPDEL